MSLPAFTSGTALTTPTCVNAWVEYPFRDMGDPATKVYVHMMQVKLTSYAPLDDNDIMTAAAEKPERSPFSDDADAFYVGDSVPRQIDGGMVEFTRTFANIPADRTVGGGTADPLSYYAFEFPDTASISNTYVSTSAETFSHDAASHTSTLSFNLSAGDIANLEVGQLINVQNTTDKFFIEYDNSPPIGATITTSTAILSNAVITIKTASKITCEYVWTNFYDLPVNSSGDNLNAAVTTYEAIDLILPGRDAPLEVNSPSFMEVIYVKSDNIYLLNNGLNKQFRVRTSSGSEVADKSLSSFTDPTNAEYGNLVLNGLTINAEDQTIARWKGNIFELRTIQVIAQ